MYDSRSLIDYKVTHLSTISLTLHFREKADASTSPSKSDSLGQDCFFEISFAPKKNKKKARPFQIKKNPLGENIDKVLESRNKRMTFETLSKIVKNLERGDKYRKLYSNNRNLAKRLVGINTSFFKMDLLLYLSEFYNIRVH